MGEALRAGIYGIPADDALKSWVRAQVIAQKVRNVGQVAQGQHVGRVVTRYRRTSRAVDGVDAPSTSLWRCWARVDRPSKFGAGVGLPPHHDLPGASSRPSVESMSRTMATWQCGGESSNFGKVAQAVSASKRPTMRESSFAQNGRWWTGLKPLTMDLRWSKIFR